MKQRNAEILLIIVIASRIISYLLSKIGLNGIPPLELLAIRFALTTLILLLLFHRRLPLLTRQLWKAAGLLGTFLFACMACELISLTTIPSSTAAFLENTSAVWVLILMAVVSRHWPGKQVLTATGLLLIGIACLTLQGAVFHLAPGEIICLTGSVFYALWICLTARLARQYDPLLLGILQMVTRFRSSSFLFMIKKRLYMIRNSHSVSFREKFSRVRRTRRNQENFYLLLAVFSELM